MPPRGNCSSCDVIISEKEIFFDCASCDYQCHAKCDKRYFDVKERIADITYKHFEKLGYRWFCNKCTQHVPNLHSDESVVVKEIKSLSERIVNIEKLFLSNENKSSYASVAKGEPERSLVITNSDKKMTSKKVAKIMCDNFDPVFAKVSALHVLDNKCVIKTKLDEENFQVYVTKIQSRLGKSCEVKPMKKRKPRVKIIGKFTNECEYQNVASDLVKQNSFIQDGKEINVVKRSEVNIGTPLQIIIETSPRDYHAFLKVGYATIGYTRCKVYDANVVPRCFKCSKLGHFEKNCLSSTICCPKCAGNHRLKECKTTELKCTNCLIASEKSNRKIDTNHAAYDRNCPTSNHRTNALRSFFDNENG